MFHVFVYGTLKRGYRNHHLCEGVTSIVEASVVGQIYDLPQGYPMLSVPTEHVVTLGTADPLADLATLQQLSSQPVVGAQPPKPPWRVIHGELISFDDPHERLPRLDALEDFEPGGDCRYHRVLVATHSPPGRLVWVYVAPEGKLPSEARLLEDRWPA